MNSDPLKTGATQTIESTAHLEELAINLEKFDAVPEHDGNLQKLIERYGDNPGACPFIKSMGESGIELVQKLAAAENNPDRGPTMRELIEAKKKQNQASDAITKKPKLTKNIETVEAKLAAERKPGAQVEAPISSASTYESLAAREYAKRITEEVPSEPETTASAVTKPTEVSAAESIESRQVAEVGTPAEIASEPQPEELVVEIPKLAEPLQTQVPPTETFDIEIPAITELVVEAKTDESTRQQTLDVQEFTALAFDEVAELVEDQIELAPSDLLAPEIGSVPLTADELLAPEAVTSFELQEEIGARVQLLEPSYARAAQETLSELAEVIEVIQNHKEPGSLEKIELAQEVEQLFGQLLESLGLDYSEETVQKFTLALLAPENHEKLAEDDKLPIDKLNRLGTFEYKTGLAVSLITSLLQMLEDKAKSFLHIGKYALTASLA